MKQANSLLPAALLALALAACSQADPNNIAIDDANNVAMDVETLPPSEEGSASSNSTDQSDDGGSEVRNQPLIPAQYRGRWGMGPADCTSTRGDAKGLMTIGDDSIRFYESVASLQEQRPAIATSFSGAFGFTGEGMTWEKVMTFTRTSDTLVRGDKDGSYSYKRC